MLVELPARGVRVGGVTVAPGEARAVAIALVPRTRAGKQALPSIPAWVVVGQEARAAGQRGRGGSGCGGDGGACSRQAGRQPGSGGADRQRGGGARIARAWPAGAPRRARGPTVAVSRRRNRGAPARDAFTLFSDVVIGAQRVDRAGRTAACAPRRCRGARPFDRPRRAAPGPTKRRDRHLAVARKSRTTCSLPRRRPGFTALELSASGAARR